MTAVLADEDSPSAVLHSNVAVHAPERHGGVNDHRPDLQR